MGAGGGGGASNNLTWEKGMRGRMVGFETWRGKAKGRIFLANGT